MTWLRQSVADVCKELEWAEDHFPSMVSPHEGFAILKEEVDELWEEVKRKGSTTKDLRKEAVQVAAMALRFIEDVCDK